MAGPALNKTKKGTLFSFHLTEKGLILTSTLRGKNEPKKKKGKDNELHPQKTCVKVSGKGIVLGVFKKRTKMG